MFLYIGPELDGGLIVVILGIVLSFFLAIIGLLWFPIKKGIKKIKSGFKKSETENL